MKKKTRWLVGSLMLVALLGAAGTAAAWGGGEPRCGTLSRWFGMC